MDKFQRFYGLFPRIDQDARQTTAPRGTGDQMDDKRQNQDKTRRSGKMAGVTGLEPAASGVTGRRSNQLSYTPAGPIPRSGRRPTPRRRSRESAPCTPALEGVSRTIAPRSGPFGQIHWRTGKWWAVRGSNPRPSGCKPDALPTELTAPARPPRKRASGPLYFPLPHCLAIAPLPGQPLTNPRRRAKIRQGAITRAVAALLFKERSQ